MVVRTFSKAYGLAGLRIGYGFCAPELARKLWTMQLPFGIGITGLVAVAASYDAESELQQRIRMITAERRYLRMRLRAMGVYSTDAHANFVYLPSWGRPWREVFDGTGLQVRNYADGGVRITVGSRQSTRAVLSAAGDASALTRPDHAGPTRGPKPGVRYEEACPRNRRGRTSATRSRWRAPTGSAPAGARSPTAWSR